MRNVTFTIIAVLSLLFTSINAQIPSEVNWALTANQNVSSVAGWMLVAQAVPTISASIPAMKFQNFT